MSTGHGRPGPDSSCFGERESESEREGGRDIEEGTVGEARNRTPDSEHRDTHAHKGRRGLLVVELIDVMVVDVAAPCGGGEEALR